MLLLVEDDPNLGLLLKEYLTGRGYPTDLAIDGQQGWQKFQEGEYELCIFDVMMPKKDGFSLAKEVRLTGRDIPIIFLTAKSMKDDTILGFKFGADDYITKPFDRDELIMRIEAVLRRYRKSNNLAATISPLYNIGRYTFNYERQQLACGESVTKLTGKESELLKLLCQHIGQIVGRSHALKMIWGDDTYFNARSMDVYITKLRKHLKDDPSIQIVNLHGEGFKILV